CLTCSPNVRTSLNAPSVGLNPYFSAGMASANAMNCLSIKVNHCDTVAAIGSTGCCAGAAAGSASKAATANVSQPGDWNLMLSLPEDSLSSRAISEKRPEPGSRATETIRCAWYNSARQL